MPRFESSIKLCSSVIDQGILSLDVSGAVLSGDWSLPARFHHTDGDFFYGDIDSASQD